MQKIKMEKHNNLEDALIDKRVEIIKENIKAEKITHEFPVFPIEYLPKDFTKVSKNEIVFNKQSIKKRQIPHLKEFFNLNIYLEIDCYLLNPKVYAENVIKFVFSVLDGIAFKDKKNVKELKVRINDTTKDPYNQGQNFIGIVIKKFQEKKHPDKIVLQP